MTKKPDGPDMRPAIDFLKRFRPEGPWILCAIIPGRGGIETRTFTARQQVACARWLGEHNGTRNLYFHVNTCRKNLTDKAKRTDIAAVDWLHVDIDPRVGEDLEAEQGRALELLTSKLPEGVPEPSIVNFSGGGYQGFWKLDPPLELDGEEAAAEDAKRWNQWLEMKFQADACHNIDRIMRLPGTINVPDDKKKKRGQKPVTASVVSFTDKTHRLDAFQQAPAANMPDPQAAKRAAPATVKVDVENVADFRIDDVNELDKWGVPDKAKVAIVQGHHPDEPLQGKNGRSEWVFYVTCALERAGVPDDVIYAILTDKDFGISEHILAQSNVKRAVLRQIERAKGSNAHPVMVEMNEEFMVLESIGGRCRVAQEMWDDVLGRHKFTLQTFADFRNRYNNKLVQDGVNAQGEPKFHKMGDWWLGHRKRRQFLTAVFSPGRDTPGTYNFWQGFAVQQQQGQCGLFLDHIRDVLCNGEQNLYDYVVGWLARAVQQPATPGEVALVLRGGRGVGKSVFATEFGALFGRHFLQVSNSSHLASNFNGHLQDLVVLFADEAFYANDRKHESILKTLITERTLAIEKKGLDVEQAPNCVHLIMASNSDHVVPAGADERRYMVLDVADDHKTDHHYFRALIQEMRENGGREALLHFLMTHDLKGFNVRNVPQTAALDDQKVQSLNPFEKFWYESLQDDRILKSHSGWPQMVAKDDLRDAYIKYAEDLGVRFRGDINQTTQQLEKLCGRKIEIRQPRSSGRRRHYVLPPLEVCRDSWVNIHGFGDWPKVTNTKEVPLENYDELNPPF